MADRYQKQIYFPKEEEEILKEINIRSEQVIEKSECSICRGGGKGRSFLWLFFFFSSKRLQLWSWHSYNLKNVKSMLEKFRKMQNNWLTSELSPGK